MIECGLELVAPCNYSCWYCSSVKVAQEPVLYDLDALADTYSKLGVPALTCIYCGGGEPTLHPQIREILNLATMAGGVYMWTNASVPVGQWIGSWPERVFIDATLHPGISLLQFADSVQAIRDAGMNVRVTFVGYPTRLATASYQEGFEALDFPTAVFAYRDSDNNEIYSPGMERRPIPPPDDANGRECIAGHKSVFIRADAQLYRCARGYPMDSISTQPTHCDRFHCSCSLQLHNTVNHTPRFEEICQHLTK